MQEVVGDKESTLSRLIILTGPRFCSCLFSGRSNQDICTPESDASTGHNLPHRRPLGFPASNQSSGHHANLRVLSWNLNRGTAGPAVPQLAAALVPDIICLQEADPWARNQLYKMLILPQFQGWDKKVCGELVVLSRFPLEWLRTTHSALWVTVDVDGKQVVVVNAHLRTPISYEAYQAQGLPSAFKKADELRNTQTRHPTPKSIENSLRSSLTHFARRAEDMGSCFPRSFPLYASTT